jgi:hypothetical protein
MPSGHETVVNRALSGDELKKLILADAQRLVDNEGLLSPHIAYGRIGYTLTLKLHIDNPYIPDSTITAESKPIAGNVIEQRPELAAIESAPLANPSPAAEVGAMELERKIDSPNAERLRESMPIPVIVKQQDGTVSTEQITYPEGSFPELGPGEVMIRDATEMAKQQWASVEPSQTIASPE